MNLGSKLSDLPTSQGLSKRKPPVTLWHLPTDPSLSPSSIFFIPLPLVLPFKIPEITKCGLAQLHTVPPWSSYISHTQRPDGSEIILEENCQACLQMSEPPYRKCAKASCGLYDAMGISSHSAAHMMPRLPTNIWCSSYMGLFKETSSTHTGQAGLKQIAI